MLHTSIEPGDSRAAPEPPHNDNIDTIRCGTERDNISLKVAQGIVWIHLEQEPSGDALRQCIQRAVAAGMIGSGRRVLVDMRRFTGPIDWAAIHDIRAMARWGGGGSRVAYVARSGLVAVLLRVFSDLFPRSSHRFFTEPDEALIWLRR